MRSPAVGFAGVGLFACNVGRIYLSPQDSRRADFEEVAVDENEIRIVAGKESAFVLSGEHCVHRALDLGVEHLTACELVLGEVGPGAFFVQERDRGIETAKSVIGSPGNRNR